MANSSESIPTERTLDVGRVKPAGWARVAGDAVSDWENLETKVTRGNVRRQVAHETVCFGACWPAF